MEMNQPLVSCIMPTFNRRAFAAQAIEYFLRQDYSSRELIILDDGTDAIGDLVPSDPRIRYLRLNKKYRLGAKRNLACREAAGEIIVHWDDDDWMAPHRIRYQVETLLNEQADLCGLDNLFFFDPSVEKAWRYIYPKGSKPWVYGGTFCYKKSFWSNNPFPDVMVGEDNRFVWNSRSKKILALGDNRFYAALVHAGNTSPKRTAETRWQLIPISGIQQMMNRDWTFYEDPFEKRPKSMVLKMNTWENETPDVSIGIVVRENEGGDSLRRLLEGIYKNTAYPYDLFILDAGSRGAAAMLENSEYKNVKRIIAADKGKPHFFNRFIQETQTPYLVLLENAAYVTAGWLTLLVDCLKSHPGYGVAGPSTSRCWNEQQVVREKTDPWSLSEIEAFGLKVKQRYGNKIQELSQLHGINDFCYVLKREMVEKTGYFDEAYGKGPCFEIDYNTRAARAGYGCVWVCGAYVHRFPREESLNILENKLFAANKHLYQKKFCDLQLRGKRQTFCSHCHGEACRHFAPSPSLSLTAKANKSNEESPGKSYEKPLVSCIMPTYNRRLFVPRAITYFLQQDYPNKELVIVDDGTDKIEDLLPGNERITYLRLEQKKSIGHKRNLAVRHSRGDIIAHWDDDDWYGKERLSYQVQPLLDGKAHVCGLDTGVIYNIIENTFWSCAPGLHAKMFYADLHGGTIVYLKKMWEKYAKYPDISLAEDAAFLKMLYGKAVITRLDNNNIFIYVRHDKNAWEFICGHFIDSRAWKMIPHPPFLIQKDLNFYRDLSLKLI